MENKPFLKPKLTENVNWSINIKARRLISAAAKISKKSESQIVSQLALQNLSKEDSLKQRLKELIEEEVNRHDEFEKIRNELSIIRGENKPQKTQDPGERLRIEIKKIEMELTQRYSELEFYHSLKKKETNHAKIEV